MTTLTNQYDVPAELVTLAREAGYRHSQRGGHFDADDYRAFILAEVLRAYAPRVRAEIAEQLLADAQHYRRLAARNIGDVDAHQACAKAFDEAAERIRRGVR